MRNLIPGMTSVVLLVMQPVGVKAQDNSVDQLDAISVTATREEERTLDIPASIGVINEQSIELDKPNYQKELFNSVAGVRVTQTGSTLGHKTSIRMPLNTGPYYLFLQDGIPVQSSGFFNHNGLAYTNFSSAESAEVLKGAGTALYGSDAIAATINVISNDPSLSDGFKVKAGAGSDGFYSLGLSGGTQYGNDTSAGFEFSHSESDGWRDHTRSERSEVNLTHFIALDDENTFKTIFSANSTDAEMSGSLIGLDELENNPESVGNIQPALDMGLDIKRQFDFARVSTEWTHFLSEETELSTIGYVRTNRNRYVATWERNLPQNDSPQETVGLLFKANIDRGDTLWMLGTDFEVTQSNRTYTQLFDYVPGSFGSPVQAGDIYDYDVDYLAIAPYLRVEHDISEKLEFSAGLRYDASKFDYTNNLADGQYGSSSYFRPDSSNDPSFQHLSPKLSLSYRLDNRQNVYARFANGFRIPQATRLYSLRTDNIDFELDPETSNTLEFGYKLGTQKHQFDASLYFMNIDDSIVRRENIDGDRYYVNGGETIHQGIELSWLNLINNQFSTRIAYSYSVHEYVNDEVYGNNEQASAPNDVANLRLIYKPESIQGLSSLFEIVHVGEYWLDDSNTRTYEGYTIAHLKANYQVSKQMQLSAKINNIADKIYSEDSSFSYGNEKYTPGAPRQIFASLEYSFE